jgi:hypothetical protein
MNKKFTVTFERSNGEIDHLIVTGEDHIDAEATLYMVADEEQWAIEEVLNVSEYNNMVDEVYEMEDHDNWLDQYVHTHY